jgi:hypothetical protein
MFAIKYYGDRLGKFGEILVPEQFRRTLWDARDAIGCQGRYGMLGSLWEAIGRLVKGRFSTASSFLGTPSHVEVTASPG